MAADVDGVLLAGGRSSRAGVFKLEAEVGGKPLLGWGLEAMASVCGRVFVVAGHDAEKIAALAAGCDRVEVVINERYREQLVSLKREGDLGDSRFLEVLSIIEAANSVRWSSTPTVTQRPSPIRPFNRNSPARSPART